MRNTSQPVAKLSFRRAQPLVHRRRQLLRRKPNEAKRYSINGSWKHCCWSIVGRTPVVVHINCTWKYPSQAIITQNLFFLFFFFFVFVCFLFFVSWFFFF